MDYAKISPEVIGHLYNGYNSLKKSPLSKELRILIELLVSEINGCKYCIKLHKNEAITHGIGKNKYENLRNWRENNLFQESERECFAWAESLTIKPYEQKVKDTNLAKYLDEREVVDLTICISLMNTFNRLAISMS